MLRGAVRAVRVFCGGTYTLHRIKGAGRMGPHAEVLSLWAGAVPLQGWGPWERDTIGVCLGALLDGGGDVWR